ncbi:MAG TPA: lipid II flippase MurJ [Streptosporangiaceae bacterium]|nr:lipid II flippase MurJ [Streptosporangiaceae bacterium]
MPPDRPVLMDQEYSDPARGPGAGIARGAALIAGLTVLSRLMGLVRTLVFSQSIGADCLGTAYATANQVPNLIYELVLGGALTSAMVPVLARSAARAAYDPEERARISQITSALLTWSVLILAPLTLATAAAAGPIAALLNPVNANTDCLRADMVSDTRNMIEVFSPQVILYGLSVVLFGLLQAYRRFTAPALAPLISSLVLIASYLTFAALDRGLPLAQTPLTAELILAAGTTLGVAALVLAALPAMRRLHLTYRPALRFPAGVGRRAGGLAFVGVIELVTIDVSNVVVIALANGRGDTGALVIFNYASLVFNAIYAVLALSVVTSAFPVLSAREGTAFDRACAGSTRAVLLLAWLGTAVVAAIAVPLAHVLAKHPDQVPELIEGFALFAPGMVGVAVIANLSRVMFAIGRLRMAAVALAGSWLLVIAADLILAGLAPPQHVVAALALGNTIGQTVLAIPLVVVTRKVCGKPSLHGTGYAALVGLTAAVAGGAAGVAASMAIPANGRLLSIGIAIVAAGCAVITFGLVAFLLDRGDLKALISRLRPYLHRAGLR